MIDFIAPFCAGLSLLVLIFVVVADAVAAIRYRLRRDPRPCVGCLNRRSYRFCAVNERWIQEVDPYIGREGWVDVGTGDKLIRHMRSETGQCGPAATLYAPDLRQRVIEGVAARIRRAQAKRGK